jgi:hypothetical protein
LASNNPSPLINNIGLGNPTHQFGGSTLLTAGPAEARLHTATNSRKDVSAHRARTDLVVGTIFLREIRKSNREDSR